ncbi:MAG: hypothetical protein IKW71_02355, partial [Elusimicrobiaceae bacterium]|nr:hypothetical protein [Elusimicrobiaceae bacterium]
GWFGASDYTFYHGDTTLTVPFDNQELTVSVQTPETVKPGQQVPWKLMAKNAHNAPINGQASVSIYDKSLDYYAQARPPFTLSSLFDQQAQAPHLIFSRLPNNNLEVFSGTRPSFWEAFPQIPSLDLQMQRRYYRNTSTYGTTKMALAAAAPMMKGRAVAEEALESVEFSADVATDDMANQVTSMDGAVTAGSGSAEQPLAIRTNFAETAYFNSLLPVKNGVARFTFTFPQSVTTWNILGFAITQDAHVGNFTASTITRKDFMVRLHLPRFYREKDQGILQASVMNLTTRKLTVPVTISVTQGQQNKTSAFGISAPTQNITVAPNSTAFAQWNVTLPPSPGLYQVTASAHSTTDSDGEQRTLPIFPSLARLLASAHVTLQNGTNTLSITELNDVNDAQAELAALTLNPSLALSVLNSMPNLLCYPYKDLISSLNRYVPLAIVHTFYNTYPQLKQAVKKLPKRTGVTAPWDEQDPLRLTMLEQTPWLQLATGNTQHSGEIISLFDDTLVSKRLTQEKANVLKFQNANGSFSWFVGGPEDTYLTLRALEAFSQAVQFGAEVPEAHVKKALSYIVPKIEHQLTDDTTGSVGTVSYALYAAYTLSAFPANWSETAAARPYIKKWVDYADQQARFMTPLGQIYAAAVYHRLGDDIKANAYLDKVL